MISNEPGDLSKSTHLEFLETAPGFIGLGDARLADPHLFHHHAYESVCC